jgi:integrase
MKESGYSSGYIYTFKKEIKWILSEAGPRVWNRYEDIYQYYESILHSQETLKKKHAILGALQQFDLYEKYPDSKWNNLKGRETLYQRLAPEFKELIDYYVKAAEKSGKKSTTIHMESSYASNFLFVMQSFGFSRLNDITEKAVMSLFVSPEGERLKCHTNRKSITAFLKACIPINEDACRKVVSFLPKTRNARKNIQYLTAEEIARVRKALNDMASTLSLCDRAIGKLALYTGLRSSDIAAMELTSIDWERDIISIRQQKTENPLELPLRAVVGNAIFDYLADERPCTDNPSLFISLIGAHRKMSSGNMRNVSVRIMNAAGIRQAKGDRKGLHIFRHHVAKTLLGNDVSQAVISRTLGHASQSSTEAYLTADFINLNSCALSISLFPMSGEVFNIG